MQQKDDLEAVRTIVAALDGFAAEDQERILRWVREKAKLPSDAANLRPASPAPQQIPPTITGIHGAPAQSNPRDLKSFVAEKKPKSDVQFAATVAYYYRFEAPAEKKKDAVNSEDLQEGCRLASRERFTNPGQTLRNAHTLGLLDKGSQAGSFALNSVGENLVAMTLPTEGKIRVPAKKGAKKKVGKAKAKPLARKSAKK